MIDLPPLFSYFQMKMEKRYSVEQVIFAIDKYTDTKNDIPAPSDIINILTPAKPRITEAEYVAAQKWQERNYFPVFSDAKDTIEAYQAQEKDARGHVDCENKKILEIAGNTFKRIEG